MERVSLDRPELLPPMGIEPGDEYDGHGISYCRTEDKNSLIVYVSRYRPESDPHYEHPDHSAFAWQNQEDPMYQIAWLKKIHEVISSSKPTSHPRVQREIYAFPQMQPETGFPIVEFVSHGNLFDFLHDNPKPQVPFGKGSENPLTLKFRWALNIASGLAFLHTKSVIFEGLSPINIHLRPDLSAALVDLDKTAFKDEQWSDRYWSSNVIEYVDPKDPETWPKPSEDIYSFGKLLYYLIEEKDPEYFPSDDSMPEIKPREVNSIIEKCLLKEFETMNEVLQALKDIVVKEGLELNGEDDLVVDPSVKQFESCGFLRNYEKTLA